MSISILKHKKKGLLKKKEDSIIADLQNLERQETFVFRTKADIIKSWARMLKESRADGEYTGAVNTICNYIVIKLRDEYHLSYVYVFDVLDNEFKDPEMVRRAEMRQPSFIENQNANVLGISEQDKRVIHPVLLKPTINLIDLPKDEIQNRVAHISKARREIDREFKVLKGFADIHKIALPLDGIGSLVNNSIKDSKICKTPKEDPRETDASRAMAEMIEDVERFLHDCEEIRKKLIEFPPTDKKFIRDFARGITMFSLMLLKPFDAYLQPAKDEKWAQVYPEWWTTQGLNVESGKHAAGKKSAVIALSGKLRKLTREQVGDREKVVYDMAKAHTKSVKFFHQLWDWHNHYARPRIAQRRLDLSPKLQEQA